MKDREEEEEEEEEEEDEMFAFKLASALTSMQTLKPFRK